MNDQEFKYDVFLSYTEANKAWGRELFEHLRDEGVKVFFAEETMPPGANIPLGVMDALRESRKVAIVMTRAYFAKTWPRAEFASILSKDPENKERRLIPLLRESCEAPDLISPLKSIDFTNDDDIHLRLRQLVEALDLPRLKFAETRLDLVEEEFDFRERRINKLERLGHVKGKRFQDEIASLFELQDCQVERKQLFDDKGGGRAAGLVVRHSIPFTGDFVQMRVLCQEERFTAADSAPILAMKAGQPADQWLVVSSSFDAEARKLLETAGIKCKIYDELLHELFPLDTYANGLIAEYEGVMAEKWQGEVWFIRPNLLTGITYEQRPALAHIAGWRGKDRSNLLVVLGNLGTGKSTLMRFLA